ncbi:glycosyltransferase family 2 protein [Aeromonas salmonicida]|uniref:glycosyltransferase family 2 protein n=1 Tax=Aeromonas salmonicida TaxID=645 RepID=UPI000C1B8EC6|nr:glycosyltransferase family 2 protein [Aeromonas salmonicida]ATU98476.1 glycosyl transferase family 2 [Aeromonas salmonicida]HEG4446347.1 glycosyltransferase family 2 protein [Aeromonas hydrophila]
MAIYVSVVSHGHAVLINELLCLSSLSDDLNVVIKSNKPDDYFNDWICRKNYHWINEQYGYGFGHNNNIVFNFCKSKLGMLDSDYFVVLNPDVIIESDAIEKLIGLMMLNKCKLAAINLYKDNDYTIYDNSIRRFPSMVNFGMSFLGLGNNSILGKSELLVPSYVDWAAGSFLAFNVEHYEALGGFDEKYFMYCEDIDICYRSHLTGEKVLYFPNIRAIHLAMHNNRDLFSKHFYWHVKSVFRFLLRKVGVINTTRSLLKS